MPTTKAPIMGDNPIIAAIPAAAKKDAVTIPSTAPSDLQLLREHHLLWLFLPALHDIIHQREKRVALHYSVRLDVIRKTSKLWILLEGLPVSILQDTLVDIHYLEYIYSDRRPEGHWMNLCLYLYDLRRRRHLHSPLLLEQNPYSRIYYFSLFLHDGPIVVSCSSVISGRSRACLFFACTSWIEIM